MQPHNVNYGRSCDMRNGDVTRIRAIVLYTFNCY